MVRVEVHVLKSTMKSSVVVYSMVVLGLAVASAAIRLPDDFPYDGEPNFPVPTKKPRPPGCWMNPCRNRASCAERSPGYRCTCRPGFEGTRCERAKWTELTLDVNTFWGTLPDKDWDFLFGKDNYSDLFIKVVAHRSSGTTMTRETRTIDEVNTTRNQQGGIEFNESLWFGFSKWTKVVVSLMDRDLLSAETIYTRTYVFGQMALPVEYGDSQRIFPMLRENGRMMCYVSIDVKLWHCHDRPTAFTEAC
ncbi:hypothetical protein NDN08_004885 [Rhodosorus marinus]|uniref:EGF-like domain-containing protein n=1 Tax=Rhodosorus marinus TaxID=101924 RepID=A0AAV8UEY6_9RHOD|nr:hypothetical protein NDN08_004885 [Rhodosorus marinus]